MGRIKHTRDFVFDTLDEVAHNSWDDFQDEIENAKEDAKELMRAMVEDYLAEKNIDLDDWESVVDEDLEDLIESALYDAWEV